MFASITTDIFSRDIKVLPKIIFSALYVQYGLLITYVLIIVFLKQNDPNAHENFLKINRAYEVLKDEDLRKKYDKYGEKGLEDQQQGGRYESWHFYRYDFGKL